MNTSYFQPPFIERRDTKTTCKGELLILKVFDFTSYESSFEPLPCLVLRSKWDDLRLNELINLSPRPFAA